MQAFLFTVLGPILTLDARGGARSTRPRGGCCEAGERIRLPELGDLLERLGAEGPGFLYTGDTRPRRSAHWVLERGGLLTEADLAAYEVVEREPARVAYHGREVRDQPAAELGRHPDRRRPGGARARSSGPGDPVALAETLAEVNRARDEAFLEGLRSEGYLERFLAKDALDNVATEVRSRLGNTTHLSVMDADGGCVSVTCSNGSCSGVVVPGTGMHLNNMLGEEDLNPLGYHQHEPGTRVPSMMAPTVVLAGRPRRGGASARPARTGSARPSSRPSWRSWTTGPPPRRRCAAAPARGGRCGGGRARGRRRRARRARAQRLDRAALGGAATSSSAASRPWRATRRPASSPAAATPGGAASRYSWTDRAQASKRTLPLPCARSAARSEYSSRRSVAANISASDSRRLPSERSSSSSCLASRAKSSVAAIP